MLIADCYGSNIESVAAQWGGMCWIEHLYNINGVLLAQWYRNTIRTALSSLFNSAHIFFFGEAFCIVSEIAKNFEQSLKFAII